ncbi:hypothetical protein ISS40_11380 [Candidatus Bathyarchaeota archaeon]|nr:hypothetical protein [Candidatus Bathyarchaeota archaeon]
MSSVSFDDSFITRVYTDPAPTLAAYDSLWREEVFTLVSDWHRHSGTPLDHAAIKAHLRDLTDQDEEEQNDHPVVRLRDRIMAHAPTFQADVFPRLAPLLPPETPIEATATLVALIAPGAFCARGRIVVNLSHPQFLEAGENLILNVIAHELYHFGFHAHQDTGSETPPDASPRELADHALWWLQNEGMATYASYNLTDTYPADVRRLTGSVNEILTAASTQPRNTLRETLWTKGVKERAFYVVGAHIARTIDREKGREALISLIHEGPRSYAEAYNALAPRDMTLNL